MGGIAGFIHLGRDRLDSACLGQMARALAHRGPDDEGMLAIDTGQGPYLAFCGDGSAESTRGLLPRLGSKGPPARVGLAHRRYLSSGVARGGHQPMIASDGRLMVTFAGEIYNHHDLRHELARAGHVFRTRGDTEVILAAYREWGRGCAERFNGVWAFALYDRDQGELILCRDRLGEAPLVWTRIGDVVYFASEVRALMAVPDIANRRRLDRAAASRWLSKVPGALQGTTLFEGIGKVAPGTIGPVTHAFPRTMTPYWQVPIARLAARDVGVEEAADRLRSLLQDAVRLRLETGGRAAVELSGGLQSGLIAALACRADRGPVGSATLRGGSADLDEAKVAEAVARRWRTDHRLVSIRSMAFWRHVGASVALQEEPMATPSLVPHQALWSSLRAGGYTAVLTGAGGNGVFAGRPAHLEAAMITALGGGRVLDAFESVLRGKGLGHPVNRLRVGFGAPLQALADGVRISALDQAWRAAFPDKAPHHPLMALSVEGAQDPRILGGSARLSPALGPLLRRELAAGPLLDWLQGAGQAAMGMPVALRPVFLDYRVLNFAFTLPPSLLVRHGWPKWLLRKAAEPLLPPAVVWRRKPRDFPFALGRFLRDSSPFVDILLRHGDMPWLDPRNPEAIYGDWSVISFLLWYEHAINGNDRVFQKLERVAADLPLGTPFRSFVPGFLNPEVESLRAA